MTQPQSTILEIIPWAVRAFLISQLVTKYQQTYGAALELSLSGLIRWTLHRIQDFKGVMGQLQLPIMLLMLSDAVPTVLGFDDAWRSSATTLALGSYLSINWWIQMFYPNIFTASVNIIADVCEHSVASAKRAHVVYINVPPAKPKQLEIGADGCRKSSISI